MYFQSPSSTLDVSNADKAHLILFLAESACHKHVFLLLYFCVSCCGAHAEKLSWGYLIYFCCLVLESQLFSN